MAAITPTLIQRINNGSNNKAIARFTTANDTDTWTSGILNIVAYWTQDRSDPATQASVGVAATVSAGVFTFFPAENGKAFDLFIEFE
jgi:hypothetical protein